MFSRTVGYLYSGFIVLLVLSTSLTGENRTVSRQLHIQHPFLNIPVENGAAKNRMRILIDGKIIDEFNIELAVSQSDFWVFVDVSGHEGKTVTLELTGDSVGSLQLDPIYTSENIRKHTSIYHERLRPQFHFSSRRGWNNDPNGLVFNDGIYHLFYQHNPYGWNWGNMHWGHATSSDLVHWKEHPTAIYPRKYGDWAFSGSAVVDKRNTAGFSSNGDPALVAAYTSTGRGEVIAFSFDQGMTWQEYEGNPVIEDRGRGRDPKVFWYDPGNFWVMVLYQEEQETNLHGSEFIRRFFHIYNSPDLKNWTFQSKLPNFYECPELFELSVDGNETATKWVMYGANGDYLVGRFDGRTFVPESGKHQFGTDQFYASQTYNNISKEDGRRIQIGWGRINSPDMPFNQMMLFPTELTLRSTEAGVRLFAEPVREIELLHQEKKGWENLPVEGVHDLTRYLDLELLHIKGEFTIEDASDFGFIINGFEIKYDAMNELLNGVHLRNSNNQFDIEILVDRTSLEIFANSGRVYLPKAHLSPDHPPAFKIFSKGGSITVDSLEVWKLKSIWE